METKYKDLIFNGKKIIGYRVGNDGSIWSKRLRSCRVTIGTVWKKLKPITKNTRHQMITVVIDGKQKCLYIHRLVLEAFVGPCPKEMECCHRDDIPSNNKLTNLYWGTRLDNCKDRIRHGNTNQGEKCPTHKLKTSEVLFIIKEMASGERAVTLANRFGVRPGTIRDIIAKRRWKHVNG